MTKNKVGSQKATKAKKESKPSPDDEEEGAVDAFLTEVESELRDEQIQKLWDRYKVWIYGAMAGLVVAVAAFQYWQGQVEERLTQQADSFARATEQLVDGNPDAALAELTAVVEQGGPYGALADLQRAGILLEQDKLQDAISIYRTLSTDSSIDFVFSDLATLLWGIHGLDSEDPAVLEDAIGSLTDPSNAYSYSALELMALLSARRGDLDEARTILEQLLEDTNTPAAIKARAGELAAVYNSPLGAAPPRPVVEPDTTMPDSDNQAEAP
ncbi:MAG: tetratricopeptide repeat protein [Rhodospirillaceae bacterium]|nr:tetratricopeptide repeat protein [Rhodospirillaceae bacterium]